MLHIVQLLSHMDRSRFKHDQMTFDLKVGMEGVAEEKGIAPAKI